MVIWFVISVIWKILFVIFAKFLRISVKMCNCISVIWYVSFVYSGWRDGEIAFYVFGKKLNGLFDVFTCVLVGGNVCILFFIILHTQISVFDVFSFVYSGWDIEIFVFCNFHA